MMLGVEFAKLNASPRRLPPSAYAIITKRINPLSRLTIVPTPLPIRERPARTGHPAHAAFAASTLFRLLRRKLRTHHIANTASARPDSNTAGSEIAVEITVNCSESKTRLPTGESTVMVSSELPEPRVSTSTLESDVALEWRMTFSELPFGRRRSLLCSRIWTWTESAAPLWSRVIGRLPLDAVSVKLYGRTNDRACAIVEISAFGAPRYAERAEALSPAVSPSSRSRRANASSAVSAGTSALSTRSLDSEVEPCVAEGSAIAVVLPFSPIVELEKSEPRVSVFTNGEPVNSVST